MELNEKTIRDIWKIPKWLIINNTLLNKTWIKKEIKIELENILD